MFHGKENEVLLVKPFDFPVLVILELRSLLNHGGKKLTQLISPDNAASRASSENTRYVAIERATVRHIKVTATSYKITPIHPIWY